MIGWLVVGFVLIALGIVGVVTWVLNGYQDSPLALVQAGMILGGLTIVVWALER